MKKEFNEQIKRIHRPEWDRRSDIGVEHTHTVGYAWSGTHGVRYKSGIHTELDTNGVGSTRNGIYTEWDTHGVEYTRSGIHGVKYMKWDTYRVGYI